MGLAVTDIGKHSSCIQLRIWKMAAKRKKINKVYDVNRNVTTTEQRGKLHSIFLNSDSIWPSSFLSELLFSCKNKVNYNKMHEDIKKNKLKHLG